MLVRYCTAPAVALKRHERANAFNLVLWVVTVATVVAHQRQTRLHQHARSLLYNATAGGTLWWLRKGRIVNYAKHQHSPGVGTTFAKWRQPRHDVSNYIPPLSFGESFMKIRSAVPENDCLIVLVDGKKTKNRKKNNCKTYIHPPPTGRRLRKLQFPWPMSNSPTVPRGWPLCIKYSLFDTVLQQVLLNACLNKFHSGVHLLVPQVCGVWILQSRLVSVIMARLVWRSCQIGSCWCSFSVFCMLCIILLVTLVLGVFYMFNVCYCYAAFIFACS